MSDQMTFPDTVEEFMEQYKIVDTEQVYTNGTELVPIFRMKQWFEHLPSVQPEIVRCEDCRWGRKVSGNVECFADTNVPAEYHGYDWFCPNGERRTDDSISD